MVTGAAGAAMPDSVPEPTIVPGRPPRNYLSAVEHRKLAWAFIPPALVVVVTLELFLRPLWQPPPPPHERQIDTRLEAVSGPPPADGAVIILPDDEVSENVDETLLGASPVALSKVRDASFFGSRDHDAWFEIGRTLQGLRDPSASKWEAVGFTEVFSQPRSFRGRPIRMRGTLRRLEKLASIENDHGIDHFWQGWLEPAGGPASPIVVHFLRLPAGMTEGMNLAESVVVDGYFLKNLAYRAADGVRLAPLVLSLEPVLPAAPSSEDQRGGIWERSITALGVVTMLGIVATIGIGYWVVGRGRRRRMEAKELDSALSGVEHFSVSESLRKLASSDTTHGDGETGGATNE